jgi:beta-phosphoglucomutase
VTVRAIVFDFDGVLANSEPLHYLGFRDVLAERRIALSERDYYDRYLGYDDAGAFTAIAADRGIRWTGGDIARLVAEKARRLEALERETSLLFPGAAALVRGLSERCPLAIASGAIRAEILRILDRERLRQYFGAIVGAEDTPASKPAPDPYLEAVRRLAAAQGTALAPADCVAIEDSAWGLESARAAGLRTVAVATTYPADSLAADLVVPDLAALSWEVLCTTVARAGRPAGA